MQAEENRSRIPETIHSHLGQDSQVFLYGIAGVGLLVALRRVRPFAKFARPSDIPDHFVKAKVRIHADVVRIEPSEGGPLVMVESRSVVPLPRFWRSKQLPITIADVDVTANGTSWLQTVASGKKIVFLPVAKKKDSVESRISLIRPNEESLDIGTELVRLGFGIVHKVDPITGTSTDKQNLTYRESLVAAQKLAERQRNGHWHYAIRPTLWWKFTNALSTKAKSVLPSFVTERLNI